MNIFIPNTNLNSKVSFYQPWKALRTGNVLKMALLKFIFFVVFPCEMHWMPYLSKVAFKLHMIFIDAYLSWLIVESCLSFGNPKDSTFIQSSIQFQKVYETDLLLCNRDFRRKFLKEKLYWDVYSKKLLFCFSPTSTFQKSICRFTTDLKSTSIPTFLRENNWVEKVATSFSHCLIMTKKWPKVFNSVQCFVTYLNSWGSGWPNG